MKCIAGCGKQATTILEVELLTGHRLTTRPRCDEDAARWVIEANVRVLDSFRIEELEGTPA
jgi:hypothetical protein